MASGVVLKDRMHISTYWKGPQHEKNLTLVHVNEQQGAGPHSYPTAMSDPRLYCSFMESIITELASCKISFYPWSLKMNRLV